MSHATLRDLLHDYDANDAPIITSCAAAKYVLDDNVLRSFRTSRSNAEAVQARRGTKARAARSKRP